MAAPLDPQLVESAKLIPESEIPAKLRCAHCNKLAVNAVKPPCCDQSICETCQAALTGSCPVCDHSPIESADCKPHKNLRTTIKVFVKSQEKKRNKAPLTPAEPSPTPIAENATPQDPTEAQDTPGIETPQVELAAEAPPSAIDDTQDNTLIPEDQGAATSNEHPEEPIEEAQGAGDEEEVQIVTGDEGADPNNDQEPLNQSEGTQSNNNNNQFDSAMNPMMGMGMQNNAFAGFTGMMGMPGMGMMPNMFGGFGGMGMGDMSAMNMNMNMNMGMGMGNGFGGWNGQQGMNENFGFYTNRGYNQQGPYGQQMRQFSNQNYANRFCGQGAYRAYGRGRGGFRGRGGYYQQNYNQGYGNQQGWMNHASGGQAYNNPSGPGESYNGQHQGIADDQSTHQEVSANDEAQGTPGLDNPNEDRIQVPGEEDTGPITAANQEVPPESDHDRSIPPGENGREHQGQNNDPSFAYSGQGKPGPGSNNYAYGGQFRPTAAPPLNAPTGPKAMRAGFANGNQFSNVVADRRSSRARSEQTSQAGAQVDVDMGESQDRHRNPSVVSRHSRRERSHSQVSDDRDSHRRHRDKKRRHDDDAHEEDERRHHSRKSRDERSRSPGQEDERERRHSRREKDEPRSAHNDSRRESRRRSRQRSERHGDRDRDDGDRDRDRRKRSRRERGEDEDRHEDEDDHDKEKRRSDRRERDGKRSHRRRSRSPAEPGDLSKRFEASRRKRHSEPEQARDAIEPPSDDMGFKIKGSKSAARQAESADFAAAGWREQEEQQQQQQQQGRNGDARRQSVQSVHESAPAAAADPYALEREARQRERMDREQKRRESATLGKRGRHDRDEGVIDAPTGPKADRRGDGYDDGGRKNRRLNHR